MRSILEVLKEHTEQHSEKVAIRIVASDASAVEISYGDLWIALSQASKRIACETKTGDRVLLTYGDPFQFAAGFLGSLLAGCIPVPCPPLRFSAAKLRAESIIRSCEPTLVLGERHFLKEAVGILSGLSALDLSEVKNIEESAEIELSTLIPDTVAFLQYTSGSTAEPKGVMVTHRNLYAMSEALAEFGGGLQARNYFGALPLSHDMGIIGLLLQPLWLGGSTTVMRPESFLRHPEVALQCIGRYQVDFAGGPPFFFEAMLNFSDESFGKLDLSSWKVAFVGAEMVPARLLRKFSRRFAKYGFSSLVFAPCYGLAEATLLVTGVRPDTRYVSMRLPDGSERCGCGGRLTAGKLLIVDPETLEPMDPGSTGELLVQGPEVAKGYWHDSEATDETFGLSVEGIDGLWLRTGDMGRLDGEKFIPEGRRKELMIFDGLNVFPQDIESAVAHSLSGVRSVAFQPESGFYAGGLVILIETKPRESVGSDIDGLGELARSVESRAGVLPVFVGLIEKGKLPSTTSGKLRRREAGRLFLEGEIRFSVQWVLDGSRGKEAVVDSLHLESEEQVLQYMQERVAYYLSTPVETIDPDATILDLGLDSSLSMQLIVDLEKKLPLRLPDSILINNPTLRNAAKTVYTSVWPAMSST